MWVLLVLQDTVAARILASAHALVVDAELRHELREGWRRASAEHACRLAAAASLSSCIISRAVTVLLASEAREFFWALDSLSFVCRQQDASIAFKYCRQGAVQMDRNSIISLIVMGAIDDALLEGRSTQGASLSDS